MAKPAYRRFIVSTNGIVSLFRILLPSMTSDPIRAFHETMYVAVEALRYRERAATNIEIMLHQFDDAIGEAVTVKQQLMEVFEDLLHELSSQLQAYQLYDRDGVLQYHYTPHPDPAFEDIILNPIIRLTYNPLIPAYDAPLY